jgi:hypothetical protein
MLAKFSRGSHITIAQRPFFTDIAGIKKQPIQFQCTVCSVILPRYYGSVVAGLEGIGREECMMCVEYKPDAL